MLKGIFSRLLSSLKLWIVEKVGRVVIHQICGCHSFTVNNSAFTWHVYCFPSTRICGHLQRCDVTPAMALVAVWQSRFKQNLTAVWLEADLKSETKCLSAVLVLHSDLSVFMSDSGRSDMQVLLDSGRFFFLHLRVQQDDWFHPDSGETAAHIRPWILLWGLRRSSDRCHLSVVFCFLNVRSEWLCKRHHSPSFQIPYIKRRIDGRIEVNVRAVFRRGVWAGNKWIF
jgi:hypothetical protein